MRIYLNDNCKETYEKAESLLFNGNGFLGVRGNLEEWYYDHFATNRETYINGFYETKTIHYPEKMYGFAETGETMISVVDGQTTLITIGGEDFRIDKGEVADTVRYVDMAKGETVRELTWTSPKGRKTKVKVTRLASFVHKNIFAMKYEFTKLNHDEEIILTTHLNYYPVRTIDKNDPRMSHNIQRIQVTEVDQEAGKIAFGTRNSALHAECYWDISEEKTTCQVSEDKVVLTSRLTEDVFVKKLCYVYDANLENNNESKPGFELSFEQYQALQIDYLTKFWSTAKVEIEAEVSLEESVNFGTYALLQSLGTNGTTSIAAKGLSGSGYEGHYFWDTEMYIFPVFLHTQPELARQILQFRINTLEKARDNRKLFGYHSGVLYPWRTISGIESSPFFEAGSAQHHINGDIAYAFIRYYESTGDSKLFFNGGYEVLLETARLFAEIGYVKDGAFHIDKITGPDEYSVLVNDNYYTNAIVQHQFQWVHKLAEILVKENPEQWQKLAEDLALTNEELEKLLTYSRMMVKPFDKEQQIIKQDRDFLNKEKWPFWDEKKYPLLMHYHPLVIYRYQVAKQADAVLALMLFPDDQPEEVVRNSVHYYDEVTTHDSSLSYSAFATVYNRIGETEKSYRYFLENARCDLDNLHGNTKDGVHTASMGGTFMNILYGFCDLRLTEDGITLNPHLPKEIKKIEFRVVCKGSVYRVKVTQSDWEIEEVGKK